MDLIYTNAKRVDQGVLGAYEFDLSFGADENDFELTLVNNDNTPEAGSFVYMEGTEYGGIIDILKATTNSDTITFGGRTWHGILNSKVIEPDTGEDYLIVSGEANEILSILIDRLDLGGLFVASDASSNVSINNYKFHRYCKGYDGIIDMLGDNGGKLQITFEDRSVKLSAVPIVDYTNEPVDGDIATLQVEQHMQSVNHLVCLGKGDLADREVIHLYVDQFGRIGTNQHYTGDSEFADVYENTSADNLLTDATKKLKELRNKNKAEINLLETVGLTYDIGDIVGASEMKSGIHVTAVVTQKIVKITNGTVNVKYKTGG